jgi:PHYB activation tagged suppressor 1
MLGSIDVVALASAACASVASLLLLRDVFYPLPPKVLTARELVARGILSVVPFRLGSESRFAFFRELALVAPGRTVAFSFLTVQRLVVQDPDDIDYILNRNARNYGKSKNFELFARALGNGLVTIFDDELHSKHRRLVSPAFSPVSLRRISNEVMLSHAHHMIQEFQSEFTSAEGADFADIVVKDIIHRTALSIIAEAAFHTTDSKDTAEVNRLFQLIINDLWHPLHLTRLGRWLSPKLRRIDRFKKEADEMISQTARRIHEEGKIITEGTGRTIIDYLLQSKELTMDDIRDHSITFMSAGFETTSNSLQWTMALLAQNPQCQQRLYEELSLVMGANSTADIDNLRTCVFLDAVIREGMRMRPVVQVTGREAVEDDVLPSTRTVVPAGTTVLTSFMAMHHSKAIYGDDVLVYRPERWLDADVKARADEKGFLPFSLGKRNCIGKEFAWNEMMILLGVLARNFEWQFPPADAPNFFPKADNHFLNVPVSYTLRMKRRAF